MESLAERAAARREAEKNKAPITLSELIELEFEAMRLDLISVRAYNAAKYFKTPEKWEAAAEALFAASSAWRNVRIAESDIKEGAEDAE